MARGGLGRGTGLPLRERRRIDGAPAKSPDGGHPAHQTPPSRHCWVTAPVDGNGSPRPGLLLEWKREGEQWMGRVVYAAELRSGQWSVIDEWLPAMFLAPAAAGP